MKLRRLADPEIGLAALGIGTGDVESIRYVLDLVDELLGKADAEKFLAPARPAGRAST